MRKVLLTEEQSDTDIKPAFNQEPFEHPTVRSKVQHVLSKTCDENLKNEIISLAFCRNSFILTSL